MDGSIARGQTGPRDPPSPASVVPLTVSAMLVALSGATTPFLSWLLVGMAPSDMAGDVRRVVIRNEVVWRFPVAPRRAQAVEWRERKGPRCIPAADIRGAMLSGAESIDFALQRRTRIRAVLEEDCPAIDFYGGFYVEPEDAMICARRDDIRSRMGGRCRIDRFRRLEATAIKVKD